MFISTYPYRICISSATTEGVGDFDRWKFRDIIGSQEWDCGFADVQDIEVSLSDECIDFDIDINGDTNIPRLVELIHEAMETYFKEV